MHKPFRFKLARYLAKKIEKNAERRIRANAALAGYLAHYGRTSPATGCSYADYLLLYRYVKNHKPREVLECGTGFSTVVIMQALRENEEESGVHGRLVSMEENRGYYEAAMGSLPRELKDDPRLEIRLSPAVEDHYEFFRGVRYGEVPERAYDFVFIDGPDLMLNSARRPLAFNYDFVKLVRESDHPVSAFIDTRVSTCFIYSLLFPGKFRYDYLRRVGIVESVTKADLADARRIVSLAMGRGGFRRPPLASLVTGNY